MRPWTIPPRLETPSSFGHTPAAAQRSFRELAVLNRCFGGARSIVKSFTQLLTSIPVKKLRVLDLGTGFSDIPRMVARWACENDLSCQIVALDLHPEAIAAAAAASRKFAEIQFVQADAFAVPFRPRSFDIVMSSMLLHYFTDHNARRLLTELATLARQAVVVADVERHWFPCIIIDLLSRLSGDRLVRRAFRDTILRGFTSDELASLAVEAGFVRWRVRRYFPFRLVLVGFTN